MESSSDTQVRHLVKVVAELVAAARDFHSARTLDGAADADLVSVLTSAGAGLRTIESVLVATVGGATTRSSSGDVAQRLTTRLGCGSVSELAQRATCASSATTRCWVRVSEAIGEHRSISSGERLAAALPSLRAGVFACEIGTDSANTIVNALVPKRRTLDPELVEIADQALAEVASGSATFGPAECADIVRIHAKQWAAAIDPDGAEPIETAALRNRGVNLGTMTDGLIELRGRVLPIVAEQLSKIWDATGTPRRTSPTFRPSEETDCQCEAGNSDTCRCAAASARDSRTADQRRHDALASALMIAAQSRQLPTLGGASPTLVVLADEADLRSGKGTAYLPTIGERVPLSTAAHLGCAGTVQKVLAKDGRITHISSQRRLFSHHQRRAIVARDGGCIIPGCTTPANWTEIHHVHEWASGGKTHTDNGVLLCWFHHHYLEHTGWQVRMVSGRPEVLAPSWIDPTATWRQPNTSPLGREQRQRLARVRSATRVRDKATPPHRIRRT